MSEVFQNVWQIIENSNILNVLRAILILAVGWIVSLVAAKGVFSG